MRIGMIPRSSLVDLLAALSEPTRLASLQVVWDGQEHCVCELMDRLGASQSRMSRHMARLKAAGLLTDRGLSAELTHSDGVWLAQKRGKGHLPFWSRLAVKSMRAEGRTYEHAAMFQVHPKTARNVCIGSFSSGFEALSGVRWLTDHQRAPPGRWR